MAAGAGVIETLSATNLNATNVALAGRDIYGGIHQTYQTFQTVVARPLSDFILDFDLDLAYGFVGRDSTFKQLDAFAAQHPGGYFEIIADAGLGKTALAVEIAHRRDAIPFLAGASSNTHRPDQFLAHVSAALIVRHKLTYITLPERVGDDATFLGRILRESVRETGGKPIWVVVDGLDEADEPSAGSNPLLLPRDLPAGVYIVVTRRTGQLLTGPGTPVRRYSLRSDDSQQIADITTLVRTRTDGDRRITDALASADPPIPRDDFVARLVEASDGNFMYASYILGDLAQRGPDAPPLDLTNLPPGLEGYYEQFLDRMKLSQSNWTDWESLYQPVIERLVVAREAVDPDWLAAQVGRSPDEVRARVLEPWAQVLSRGRRDGWRLVHRTFGEYLEKRLNLRDAHGKVAEHYIGQRWEGFDQTDQSYDQWDQYGLRHTATHLSEAADRSTGPERHELIAQLVRLVTDHRFQRAQLAELHDPTLLRRDLEVAHRLAAKDEHQDSTFLLVSVALTLVLFHRRMIKPEAMFEAARDGDVQAAEQLLDLFSGEIDSNWHDTILVTIAWLASEKAPSEAARVWNRVRDAEVSSSTLVRLLERCTAALDRPLLPAPLPAAPTGWEAEAMLARIAGATNSSLQAPSVDPELYGGELRNRDAGGYLATFDGPLLVALAAQQPDIGEPLLRRYLDVHRAYGYPQYRNGSLMELLAAVLRHPEQRWVRDWVAQIGLVVLAAPNRGEFLESLEIAVLALQAYANDNAAVEELAARRNAAVAQAEALPPVPTRGTGDAWGMHRRRLAALAEAYSQYPAGGSDPADLAARAVAVGQGFAGIIAPAHLTLAETASVAAPRDSSSMIERALAAAEEAAHNIQDATFCARTTARVTAMRERWWSEPPLDPADVAVVIARLSSSKYSEVPWRACRGAA
jgi:hypothetical protein